MTISFKKLWGFWLGSVVGAIVYGIWTGASLATVVAGPYWIALTIGAMQLLGVGKDERNGDQ